MDFYSGVLVGILLALVGAGIGAVVMLRRASSAPLLDSVSVPGQPVVMVMMVEAFLNQQLREAMAAEALEIQQETVQAMHARVPFKMKVTDAALDVQTGQKAQFIAQLSASAWRMNFVLRPVTDLFFVVQAGRVKIVVTNVQLAGFSLPRALVDRFVNEVVAMAEAKLNHSLLQMQHDTHVRLGEIETTEDVLILKFVNGEAAPFVRTTTPPETATVAGDSGSRRSNSR